MDANITNEEIKLFNDITAYAESLWRKTSGLVGLSADPKIFSALLYKRLWSNHRGFASLWQDGLQVEADIILRAGLEAAICLAANAKMRDEFVMLMRQDAAFTFKWQIAGHRDDGEVDGVRSAERTLSDLQRGLPAGTKPAKLDWKSLADRGNVRDLYGHYRMLSGMSSHVTGASILTGVTTDDPEDEFHQARGLQRRSHLIIMGSATIMGGMQHAGMLDDLASVEAALPLLDRLNAITAAWHGDGA